jgi:sugar/nucleoside kinase (ribokinase family)
MVRFVTVGNMTIDEILLPDGRSASSQCGGNCLYAAVGARLWSDSVGIVSLVGADFPAAWLDAVRAAGIDIRGIADLPQPHGMRAGLAYRADGERAMLQDGVLGRDEYDKYPHEWQEWSDYSPGAEHVPAAYANAVGVHFAPVPVQAHEALVPAMRRPGRRMTLDSPWWDGAARRYEPHRELLAAIDALLPSEHDLRTFLRTSVDPAEGARALGRLGPAAVVVKMGARGSLVYTPQAEAMVHVPAYPCDAVDPTGAGDAFCGGFLVGLVETGDPVEAACYGTISASFVVEGFGSLFALHVARRDAEARRRSLKVQPM